MKHFWASLWAYEYDIKQIHGVGITRKSPPVRSRDITHDHSVSGHLYPQSITTAVNVMYAQAQLSA